MKLFIALLTLFAYEAQALQLGVIELNKNTMIDCIATPYNSNSFIVHAGCSSEDLSVKHKGVTYGLTTCRKLGLSQLMHCKTDKNISDIFMSLGKPVDGSAWFIARSGAQITGTIDQSIKWQEFRVSYDKRSDLSRDVAGEPLIQNGKIVAFRAGPVLLNEGQSFTGLHLINDEFMKDLDLSSR